MKKFMAIFLTIGVLAAFSLGCANIRIKPNEVKCPKCGAIFPPNEGRKEYQRFLWGAPSPADEGEKEHLRSLGFGGP